MATKRISLTNLALPTLALALVGLANCTVNTHDNSGATGGTGGGGAAGSSAAGSSGALAVTEDGGEGGAAGAAGPACADVSGEFRRDTKIGPGCVSLGTTTVLAGKFTIAPGTTLQVKRGGSFEVTGAASLNALGTADLPIVFTSAEPSPAAGDWKCVEVDADSPDSVLDHVRLEYGGSSCGNVATSLLVVSGVDQLTHVEVQNGLGHGLRLLDSASGIRQLRDLVFSSIEKTSLLVTPVSMNALNAPITLDKDDRYIDVDSGALLDVERDVTWHNVGLPYRFDSEVDIGAAVTIEPGTTLEPTGLIWVETTPSAVLTAVGTAAAPIRWTSSEASPAPGDWGCIDFTQEKTSRLEFNEFEYGGRCSYGGHQQTLLIEIGASATFKNLSFNQLPDLGIQEASGCPPANELTQWCAFQYQAVQDPVFCNEELACK